MRRLLFALTLCALTLNASPTRNNDDSCDISVAPAATLLLPYFEVSANGNVTTLFTVINADAHEQIAHVTLWTDYGYPVVAFNIYLTGYDTQSIDLHDVIWRGIIAPDLGTGAYVSEIGDFSVDNPDIDVSDCDELPGDIPQIFVTRMQQAFTLGRVSAIGSQPGCETVGDRHINAVGYATIDVVRRCTTSTAWDPIYLQDEIRFDNVLLGDYQQIELQISSGNLISEGGPMVHIRAVSEGGSATQRRAHPELYPVTFHRTFYSRYLPESDSTFDARQPLPALFAAHWIRSATFSTKFKIWREGLLGKASCDQNILNRTGFVETVTFDEDENAEGAKPSVVLVPPIQGAFELPLTSVVNAANADIIPRPTAGAVAGWIYFNLDHDGSEEFASQNWVITTMQESTKGLSVAQDALALGNGCTPPVQASIVNSAFSSGIIAPPQNINP